jgi:hypothetical protein
MRRRLAVVIAVILRLRVPNGVRRPKRRRRSERRRSVFFVYEQRLHGQAGLIGGNVEALEEVLGLAFGY